MGRLSKRVSIFCGGSFITKRGLRLGSTKFANWFEESAVEMEKILGRIYGSKCVSFICIKNLWINVKTLVQCKRTSSNRDGKIFLVRSCSENLSKTVVNPFINEIFSSRVLEVKFERSRKFRVDIGKEEKKGWEGSVVGEGRLFGCLVIDNRSKAGRYTRL